MKTLFKKLFSISMIFALLLNLCACRLGMSKREIPTDTSKKATVYLPENWEFVVDDEIIYIKDGDKVVAREVYEEWREKYYLDGTYYDNKDELNINPELSECFKDLNNYEAIEDDIYACDIYKITDGDIERYAIYFTVTNSPVRNGAHVLFLLFENEYSDIKVLQKITKTYKWGGTTAE